MFNKQNLKRNIFVGLALFVVTVLVLSCSLDGQEINEAQESTSEAAIQRESTREARMYQEAFLEIAIEYYEEQNAQASRLQLEEELVNLRSLTSIRKLDKDYFNGSLKRPGYEWACYGSYDVGVVEPVSYECGSVVAGSVEPRIERKCSLFSTWEVTNNSKFSVMNIGFSCNCVFKNDVYQGHTIEFSDSVFPGVTRVFECLEYETSGDSGWVKHGVWFSIGLENQTGWNLDHPPFSATAPEKHILSELVSISVQELPTVLHTALLEFTIVVDEKYPYFLFIREITVIPPLRGHSQLLEEHHADSRMLIETPETNFFAIGETYVRYVYLYSELTESICFELEAYTHSETVCVDVP